GVIKSEETIAIEFERRLRTLAKKAPKKHEAFLVQMNPRVSQVFTGNGKRVLRALEEETGRRYHFTGSEGLPLDHFDIIMEGTRDEVQERAVPFREGDEVLVHIVEPHMYDVDDAVAKIDGYIISVSGGGRYVGDRRLVRIEHAGRTSATATLLDSDGPDEPEPPAEEPADDDGVESSARRRGRRGGRRRSRATADAGATPSDTAS
ncbi:MAG TPA: ribonuclease E, partial [Solirubrobacteraceae bacterium]